MLFYGYLQSFTGYFETNSSFRVKWRSPGRVWFLFLKSFLLVLLEFSFWRGGAGHWAMETGVSFYEALKFSWYSLTFWALGPPLPAPWRPACPQVLSCSVACESTWTCLLLIIALRYTCGERKIWSNIKKYQNIMKMIVLKIFLCFLCLN